MTVSPLRGRHPLRTARYGFAIPVGLRGRREPAIWAPPRRGTHPPPRRGFCRFAVPAILFGWPARLLLWGCVSFSVFCCLFGSCVAAPLCRSFFWVFRPHYDSAKTQRDRAREPQSAQDPKKGCPLSALRTPKKVAQNITRLFSI